MVVSELNVSTNNILTLVRASSECRRLNSPTHNLNSDAEKQNHLLKYEACDQGRFLPAQIGEENNSDNFERDVKNPSPPQENSCNSVNEELSTNLFPISNFSITLTSREHVNSDGKGPHLSCSYYYNDNPYQATKNSINKAKECKCRNCGFIAISKPKLWEHMAQHLNPEKILRCSKCPFVTEYKHHLDYHIGGHEGKKPYRCEKCAYSCSNKAMLKSHSRSHSEIYPYRCKSCSYRTKYCHSIKLHLLRNKNHEPEIILDEDGKPDEDVIIDIHCNRKGPKKKKRNLGHFSHQQEQKQYQLQFQKQSEESQSQLSPSLYSPSLPFFLPTSFTALSVNNYQAWSDNVFPSRETTLAYTLLPPSIMATHTSLGIPFGHGTDNLQDRLLTMNQNNPISRKLSPNEDHNQQPMELGNEETFTPNIYIEEKPVSTSTPSNEPSYELLSLTIPTVNNHFLNKASDFKGLEDQQLDLCATSIEAPLDLSLQQNSSCATFTDSNHSAKDNISSNNGSNCLPTIKNRRKGVAYKLKLPTCSDSGSAEDVEPILFAQSITSYLDNDSVKYVKPTLLAQLTTSYPNNGALKDVKPALLAYSTTSGPGNNSNEYVKPALLAQLTTSYPDNDTLEDVKPASLTYSTTSGPDNNFDEDVKPTLVAQFITSDANTKSKITSSNMLLENAITNSHSNEKNDTPVGQLNSSDSYYCEHCEIIFHNQIMFSIHKGYHGFSSPFTCNQCGVKTINKIDFYAHLISVAHL